MNVFVVIPTIRSLDFLKEWAGEFTNCHLVIVEDHKKQEIKTPTNGFLSVRHLTWRHIREDFGKDEWIFPRQNAGIRSYGFWKAHAAGADVIITLDDDCYPAEKDFVKKHLANLASSAPDSWFSTFPNPDYMFTRGFPYGIRNKHRVVLSHGLWSNKMDMDAKTQLKIGDVNIPAYPPIRQFVPFGYFFPMSSMNLAFAREVTPLMYFPLMGKDPQGKSWGYDRYDDIWAGIFAKKILDHLGLAVVNGSPFVEHRKASDPKENILKEESGAAENEKFWRLVTQAEPNQQGVSELYRELAQKVQFPTGQYFDAVRSAMKIWIARFI